MIARFAIPFFLLMTLVVVPLILALLFRYLLPRRLWRRTSLACTFILWVLTGYGFLFGFQQFQVRHIEYASLTCLRPSMAIALYSLQMPMWPR